MRGERLRETQLAESGLLEQRDLLGRGPPVGHLDELDRVGVGRIDALEQRMVPRPERLGQVVHHAVGALLGNVDQHDAASVRKRGIGLPHHARQVVDIAGRAVEEQRIVISVPEIGLLGRHDGHVHAPFPGDLGHTRRRFDPVGHRNAVLLSENLLEQTAAASHRQHPSGPFQGRCHEVRLRVEHVAVLKKPRIVGRCVFVESFSHIR